MTYWNWDSSLNIGVEVIDGQHRRIVDYINDLHSAQQQRDAQKVSEVLMGLADYTVSHFAFEENMMSQAGYPISDSHRQVHKAFIARINKYIEQNEKGMDVTRKLMAELQIWLTNHIKNDDKDYAPYVAKKLNKGWVSRALSRFF